VTNPTNAPSFDADAVRQWLEMLHAGSRGYIHVCRTGDWVGRVFDLAAADWAGQAVSYAEHLDAGAPAGIYARITSLTEEPGLDERGSPSRGGEGLAGTLPALWADLDIAGPGHKTAKPLPPDEWSAQKIVTESGLPDPTLWVHSGGGLYPIWRLDPAHQIDDLVATKALSEKWQKAIEAAAVRLGWSYGAGVGDLARVLRLPGTVNRKDGLARPCRVTSAAGPTYAFGQLVEGLAAAIAANPLPLPPPRQPPRPAPALAAGGDISPNDAFEAAVDWEDPMLLGGLGWVVTRYGSGTYRQWLRPDASSGNRCSATTGREPGRDRLYVFSDATVFPQNEPITKPHAFALLHHGGDASAAAKALHALGYGSRRTEPAWAGAVPTPLEFMAARPPAVHSGGQPGTAAVREPAPSRDGSEHAVDDPSLDTASPPEPPDPEEAKEELAALGPDMLAAKKRSRELAKQAAEAIEEPALLLDWRDLLKAYGGLPQNEFNAIAKRVAAGREERREAQAAAERSERHAIAVAQAVGRDAMLPSPADPLAVARSLMADQPATDGQYHRAWWRDDFYQWDGARWAVESPSTLRKWIYAATEHATYDGGVRYGVLPWQPDRDKVNKVLDALGTAVIQRHAGTGPEQVIACSNGVVDVDADRLLRHSPARFNLTALPYPYDPAAACPQWLGFLDQVLPPTPGQPDEQQGQRFLQEWFGYVVSGRTDLQKMASLVGPPRCGKGTIARVLAALLGPDAVAAPTVEKLAGPFGEQNLIGKALAIFGDVRWTSRTIPEVVPILLAIVGEDARDVGRKNRVDWHGKLGARFMLMSNDTPTFSDASGALGIRMIQLGFAESFAGREDTGLTARLVTELPGILNWSLAGLRALTARGRFVVPASGLEIADEVRRLSSPEAAFVEDRCELGERYEADLDALYAAFKGWCYEQGRDHVSIKEVFARNLRSAFRGKVTVSRQQANGVRRRLVLGLRFDPSPASLPRGPF
jgi:P4 family phage/plasmid primase-like protien